MHWLLVLAAENPSPSEAINDASDWILIGSTMLLFIVFLNLMRSLVFKPVLGVMAERRSSISGGLTTIEQQRAELAKLKGLYESQLAQLEADAAQRTASGVSEGKKIAQQLIEDARQEYSQLLEKGKAEIDAEVVQATSSLHADLAQMAITASDQVLHGNLDRAAATVTVHRFLQEAGR